MFLPQRLLILVFLALLCLAACSGSNEQDEGPQISGTIESGLRVLTIDPVAQDQHFTIYRGDYVRPQLTNGEPFTIQIAALKVEKQFPLADGEKPYFKVPDVGSFRFSVGQGKGVIEAINYTAAAYREVNSTEAAELIANVDPLILDVRTPREFEGGHLKNAQLIPVQVFQSQVGQLAAHKDDPIFVYCRTGNRSTVAAKMLVDSGFTNVVNLRRGIAEWRRAGQEVVK